MRALPPDPPSFRSLPAAARTYVAAVIVAGAGCLAAAIYRLRLDDVGLFAALMVLAVVTAAAKIVLPLRPRGGESNLSLSHVTKFWALFSLGAAEAACIAAVSAWAQTTIHARKKNPAYRTVFSMASLTVTVTMAGLPLPWLLGPETASFGALLRAAAVVAPIYFFVNCALVAGAIALSTRQPVWRVWQRDFLWSAPSYLAGAGLAAVAAAASARGWTGWLALMAVPLYLVFRSYHTVVARLREEQDETRRAMEVQLATIEALALAIEARAGCTPEHIRTIQQVSAMLAQAAGLSDADVQAVRTAALLHDIGNMAVPEHILAKAEALTPEEFERVKIHSRVGAEILRKVPFGGPVSDLVLFHHERWDGHGYPAGLRGEGIPIGARILAIADCYSTLQTGRPYRPARNEDEALAVLREYAGTSFDPVLVELLSTQLHKAAARPASDVVAEGTWIEDLEMVPLQDIAGAHREAQTLYEIAQGLGSTLGIPDAMRLIQDKVSRLVPFVTCALFLGDEGEGYVCRYARGPGSEDLFQWTPSFWSDLSRRLPSMAGSTTAAEELRSLLLCPLTFEGRLIGGFAIYHTLPDCFTDEHRRVLGRVSEQAAAVIFNSTRFEQTEQDSHTDALTGLPNRRSLDRLFAAGLERASRANTNVSVVVLDLDGLKAINDTYGHEAGDRALRAVGAMLRATVRQSDLCVRFGGDEFVVVLWDCAPDHEARRVQELQNAVAAYAYEPRPGVRLPLSISAGPARYPADGRTLPELLAAADERMYGDKALRRSRRPGRTETLFHPS